MMDEVKQSIKDPVTKDALKNALKELGMTGSQIVEVHTSLSSFHHVIGGAQTVVDALLELSSNGGTILMPVQNRGNTEPAGWVDPPVQASMYREMRDAIPASSRYDSDVQGMGAAAENFRHRKGVVISSHPSVAYAAWGRYAKLLCNRQSLHFPLAEESPAARLYELKGYVLLIGTEYDTCTAMHLAEYRCDCRPIKIEGAKLSTEDGEVWKKYLDLETDSSVFNRIGELMEQKNMVRTIRLGGSTIRFFPAAQAVDEATKYFERTVVYDLYR